MTDTWTPSASFGQSGSTGRSDEAAYYDNVAKRVKLIVSSSPVLAQNPDAVQALATDSTLSNVDLATQSASMTGQLSVDAMAGTMRKMDASAQRLLYSNMTDTQRSALKQLGYAGPPKRSDPSFLEQAFGPVGSVINGVISTPGHLLGEGVGDVLHGLQVVGDQPAHLYRAIRSMDDTAQVAALAGALAGVIGIAAAPFTGGLSLGLTAAAYGGGALLGATAGAAVTNPSDWVDAMSNTYDGERVFTRDSQRQARSILGNDATLGNLAKDIAYDGDLYELATDFASTRDSTDQNTLLKTVDKVARKLVDPNDPRYAQVTAGLSKVIADPNFMHAVNTLQMGKISFGRDIARGVGLTPGSGLYSAVSGAVDGLWVVTMDPTLALGAVGEWNKVRRFGVPILEEAGATAGLVQHLFETDSAVARYHDLLAEGIDHADPQFIKNWVPNAQGMVPDLLDYRNELKAAGKTTPFTRDDILSWYKRGDGIKAMAGGRGTVKAEAELIMPHMGVGSYGWARAKNYTKAVIDFADDNHLRAITARLADDIRPAEGALAPSTFVQDAAGSTPQFNLGQRVAKNADDYSRTKAVIDIIDKLPVINQFERAGGALLGSATTMLLEGRGVMLAGEHAALDIDKYADLGRIVGMTRDDRAMWKGFMLDQANPGMRAVAAESFLDSMLTAGGLKQLPEGVRLNDQFMLKYHQSYALGGLDEYIVAGRLRKVGVLPVADQAIQLMVPDMKLLRQALKKQTITKYLLNAADAGFIDTAMNKVWKPLVLMRIGFIPRAAGEEMLALLARVGPSQLLAEMGERSIAHGKFAENPELLRERLGVSSLSPAQFSKVNDWQVMAHVRPLERMFARGEWQQPVHTALANYSQWVRSALEDGVLDESTLAKIPESMRTALLGNERGARHFLLAGSNREMQEAAMSFQGKFGDALMKTISSRNAGIWDTGVRKNVINVDVPDPTTGEIVSTPFLQARGQFVNYERGDWQYNNAIHEQMQRHFGDPIVGQVYGDILTRHEPQFANLGKDEAARFAEHYDRILGRQSGAVNRVMSEILDGKPLTTIEWDALRNSLHASGELSASHIRDLQTILPDGDIKPSELLDGMKRVLTNGVKTKKAKALLAQLPDVEDFAGKLGGLDDVARGWLAPFLEHGSWKPETLADGSYWLGKDAIDGTADTKLAEAFSNPENQDAIKTSMYGVQTPDGAIVRNPVPQGMVRVYQPALSPTSTRKLDEAITALGTPGADGMDNLHAAVDALMAQWKHTTMGVGDDMARYDDVAENFFATLVQKHAKLNDLADTTERMDRTGIVPISLYSVDDPNVAAALSATLRDFVGATQETGLNRAVSYMDVNRHVGELRSTQIDGLAAPFKSKAGPVGWQTDPDLLHGRATIVPPSARYKFEHGQWTFGTSAEDSMSEWAKVVRERTNQVGRAGTTRQFFARGDRPLYKNVKDGLKTTKVEVAAGEELAKGRQYIDEAGKTVRWGDSRHMDSVTNQADDADMMWDLVGPSIRDAMDEARGTTKYTADGKRVFRSKVDQVATSKAVDLPDGALGVMMKPYIQNGWDRFVSKGFDHIGAAIDAIVRKPLAFHEYTNAYMEAKKLTRPLLLDTDLIDRLIPTHFAGNAPGIFATEEARAKVIEDARSISHLFDDPIDHLDDNAVLQTLDGMGEAGRVKLRDRADLSVGWDEVPHTADYDAAERLRKAHESIFHYGQTTVDRNLEFAKDMISRVGRSIDAPWQIAKTHAAVGALERGTKEERALFRSMDEGGWSLLQQAKKNIAHAENTVGELAQQRAIVNSIPFLDSHEVRSQMSEYGKQFAPFWYAEENFMKRWANTLKVSPEALRKGQLTYMGMKSVGVVRTDEQGRDWFVYPGSGALTEALGRIPGLGVLPIGEMMQAQTKNLLPGFNRVGVPSASPLVTFPMDVITSFFPELRPVQKAIAGGQGMNQGIARHVIPAQIMNVWEAAFGDEHTSPRYASALASAAAYMEAHGDGPPDDANAHDMDEYYRTLKDHARTVMITQALVGFVAPGSPQQITAGDTGGVGSSLTGLGVEDVNKTFRKEYLDLIRLEGVEDGTAHYMANHSKDGLEQLVNPLAFSVGMTETTAGSLLPATRQAVDFYDKHAAYLQQFPDAAGYLLPPDQDNSDAPEENAYTEQTINGLRRRRTPREFMDAIKFKEGAYEYYRSKDVFDKQVAQADAAGDSNGKAILTSKWQAWSAIYKAQHPVFADKLESSDARQQRADTLEQLRTAVGDPEAPQAWHTPALKQMLSDYDAYSGAISQLQDDRSAHTQAKVSQIKAAFQDYMAGYVIQHPELSPLWIAVIGPESRS